MLDVEIAGPASVANVEEPVLRLGRSLDWGSIAVRELWAGAGRHGSGSADEHRLIFSLSRGVSAECVCEGRRHSRVQDYGDFDLVPAGAQGVWTDAAPCALISVRMAPSLMAVAAEGLGIKAEPADLAPRLGARDPLVTHLVRALITELNAPAGRLQGESLGLALSMRLLQGRPRPLPPARQTLSTPQLRRLLDYIQANLGADLSLAHLAAVAGISVPHLTPLFRRTLGQSVHRYVMEQRVCRARELLLGGGLNVSEVAMQTGFAHSSHLSRWMRRVLGVSPSHFERARLPKEGWPRRR